MLWSRILWGKSFNRRRENCCHFSCVVSVWSVWFVVQHTESSLPSRYSDTTCVIELHCCCGKRGLSLLIKSRKKVLNSVDLLSFALRDRMKWGLIKIPKPYFYSSKPTSCHCELFGNSSVFVLSKSYRLDVQILCASKIFFRLTCS